MQRIFYNLLWFFILCLLLPLYGCSGTRDLPRKPAVFHTFRQSYIDLPEPVSLVIPFDYNRDGYHDFFLATTTTLSLYISQNGDFQRHGVLSFDGAINGFDIAYFPGYDTPFFVVLSDRELFLFNKFSNDRELLWKLPAKTSPPLLYRNFFCELSGDNYPDLVLPFRKQMAWHCAMWIFRNKRFVPAKKHLKLGHPRLIIPPSIIGADFSGDGEAEILVNAGETVSLYTQEGTILYQKVNEDGGNAAVATARLNHNTGIDLLFAPNRGQSIHVVLDSNKEFSLPTPGMANLGAYSEDLNGDQWPDIVSITMTEVSAVRTLMKYLFTGKAILDFTIYRFYSDSGVFSAQNSDSEVHSLEVYPVLGENMPGKILYWGDIDGDSFADMLRWQQPQIEIFYNARDLAPRQKPIRSSESHWDRIYEKIHLSGLVEIKRLPDQKIVTNLAKRTDVLRLLPLPSQGQHHRFVIHCRTFDKKDRLLILTPDTISLSD